MYRPTNHRTPANSTPRPQVPSSAGVFACALAVLLAGAVARDAVASPAPPAPDSVTVRLEVGADTDVSNELYYEYAYTDTTFLGRRLLGSPQERSAAVAMLDAHGLASSGRLVWALRPEVSLGDVASRAALTGFARRRFGTTWDAALEPRLEYSRDRSFGLDRREQLAGLSGVARHRSDDDVNLYELRADGEALATPGSGDAYLLAHRVARGVLGWDHDALWGMSWSARYAAALRVFPDSTQRDHQEHDAELTLRPSLPGGHSLAVTIGSTRRVATHPVASSRDCYVEPRAELRAHVAVSERWAVLAVAEGDLVRYDFPDSALDFDYGVVRARLYARREFRHGISLAVGPRAERLASSWAPGERYSEWAVGGEFERVGAGPWWLVEPALGVRRYALSEAGGGDATQVLHSSYRFAELQVIGDQPLPARLRARVTMDARGERHDDASQDSGSLYFSLGLRRLF